jgi:hypothetical protein
MTVTIWDTNTDAIATRREITGWTTPVGDASPEPIYSDPVPLERLTAAIWTRPRWNATMRADPASYGANNFNAGERILTVIDVRPDTRRVRPAGRDGCWRCPTSTPER